MTTIAGAAGERVDTRHYAVLDAVASRTLPPTRRSLVAREGVSRATIDDLRDMGLLTVDYRGRVALTDAGREARGE
jgi:hypothetical protein